MTRCSPLPSTFSSFYKRSNSIKLGSVSLEGNISPPTRAAHRRQRVRKACPPTRSPRIDAGKGDHKTNQGPALASPASHSPSPCQDGGPSGSRSTRTTPSRPSAATSASPDSPAGTGCTAGVPAAKAASGHGRVSSAERVSDGRCQT